MKTTLLLLFVLLLALAVPSFHSAQAGKLPRVQICHTAGVVSDGLADGNCVLPNGTAVAEGDLCGSRITVNEHALAAHERHGDRVISPNWPDGTNCSLVGGGGGGGGS